MMKMRQTASPVDSNDTSVPMNMRHHFKAKFDDDTEKVFWIRKSVVAGKVLDLIGSYLKLTSSSSLEMFTPGPDTLNLVEYGKPFDSQVEEGSVVIVSQK